MLEDLRHRLSTTRWPDELPGVGWGYGTSMDYLKELVDYWINDFDWRAQERLINSFSHFRTSVGGLGDSLHPRARTRSQTDAARNHPRLARHILRDAQAYTPARQTQPAHGGDASDSFDVVAPSLPGFGFSDHPRETEVEVGKTADLWVELVTQVLGYSRFASHGGDIGAGVTSRLGYQHADSLIGIHLTSITRPAPYLGEGARELTEAEKTHMREREEWAAG